MRISKRFAGYLPVVVDCETGGVNPQTDALLEIACACIAIEDGVMTTAEKLHYHVHPFPGGVITPEALAVNQIRPDHPFRFARDEQDCLAEMAIRIKQYCQKYRCRRAILVGHNAHFDLDFLLAAYARCDLMDVFPFHRFSVLDTVTLSAFFLKETVLARAVRKAGLRFDVEQAHSAIYDVDRTAALFCHLENKVRLN